MAIKIVKDSILKNELKELARERFGDLIKAVVDIEQGIMAIGGEFHADEEVLLSEQEKSKREYMWGVNLYPELGGDDFIEFDSMINLKPQHGNRTRSVEDPDIRAKIIEIVHKLVAD